MCVGQTLERLLLATLPAPTTCVITVALAGALPAGGLPWAACAVGAAAFALCSTPLEPSFVERGWDAVRGADSASEVKRGAVAAAAVACRHLPPPAAAVGELPR